MRLLVIAPTTDSATRIAEELKREPACVVDSKGALAQIGPMGKYDAVVVEFGAHGIEVVSIVERLRRQGWEGPILSLGSTGGRAIATEALNAGADDFLAAPWNSEELLARIRALIRRSRGLATSCVEVGPLSIDMNERRVTCRGRSLSLTSQEYRLLEFLLLRRGKLVFLSKIGANNFGPGARPSEVEIEERICLLRKKLEELSSAVLIRQQTGVGCILC